MSRSANLSFRMIGLGKRIFTKAQVARALAEAKRRRVTLARSMFDMGEIPVDQLERIVRTQRRHGRACVACGRPTYLLPGQTEENTPCEHCGDALLGQGDGGVQTLRPDGVSDTRKKREPRARPVAPPPPAPTADPPAQYFESGAYPVVSADLYAAQPAPAARDPLDDSGLLFSDEAQPFDSEPDEPGD